MNRLLEKNKRLQKRIKRVKFSIRSRHPKPRLVFVRSNRYLSAQIVDDLKGETIVAATTMEKTYKGPTGNKEAAKNLGALIAERAKEKGVTRVVLDRRGRLYHGRISVFADAAREKGLEF